MPENVNLYHSFQADAMHEAYREVATIVEQLSDVPRKIVDLGCCGGFLSIYLAKQLPKSDVVGVDIAENLMRTLNGRAISTNLSFICEDLEVEKVESPKFDIVVSVFGGLESESGDWKLGGAVDRYSESSSDVVVVLWEFEMPDPVERADTFEWKDYQMRMVEEGFELVSRKILESKTVCGEEWAEEGFAVLYHHRRRKPI